MFTILGAFWYVLDRRYGVGVYRKWYRLTHENPLPDNVSRGFVYNRKTRHKALMATILSTIQSVIAVASIEQPNLLVELILWIVEVPMTLLGFAIGPWVYRLWKRRDEMFDAIDDLESGDKGVGEMFKKKNSSKTSAEDLNPAKEEETKPRDDDDIDPREMIRRYTKR